MRKYCFIRDASTNMCYCSKCGHIILQDEYNMKKHAGSCGEEAHFIIGRQTEDQDYFYLLEAEGDHLSFHVVTPVLYLRPGFKDRYKGGGWKRVFSAELYQGSREVRISRSKYGNLDMWLALIRQGRVRPAMTEEDSTVARRVFPTVQGIYSLQMLVHIYKTKGLEYRNLLPEGTEDSMFSMRNMRLPGDVGGEDTVLFTNLHEIAEDELLLEINMARYSGKRHIRLLISEHYLYAGELPDLKELFSLENVVAGAGTEEDVHRFAERYPSFGLEAYWENGGRNLLLPLLSGEYHQGIELLAKSGCCAAAAFPGLSELLLDPLLYTNVKEMLGVPVSVVRKLRPEHFRLLPNVIEILSKIWKYNPRFLSVPQDAYTVPMLRFLAENNITREPGADGHWALLRGFDDRQVFRMIKYLASGKTEDYELYRDYLYCCRQIGEYPGGLTPANLKQAHDMAVDIKTDMENHKMAEAFRRQVSSPEYLELTTNTETDKEIFGKDPYVVKAPSVPRELVEESAAMHHCVRMYADLVAKGATKIFFLRQRKQQSVPFVTIEVNGKRVIQVKAAYNKKADIRAQRFVRKWAAVKGLQITTPDMRESV